MSDEENFPETNEKHWLESCKAAQLKELCKAAKLTVSGSKQVLVERLIQHPVVSKHADKFVNSLKNDCRQAGLIVSGNRFDLILRLLHQQYETGVVKRGRPVEMTTNEFGERVPKKRKTILQPKTLYDKLKAKIHSFHKLKKYQTGYGGKTHARDTFKYLISLLQDQCIESKLIESDPVAVYGLFRAALLALTDHWPWMQRPGHAQDEFHDSLKTMTTIVKAIRSHLSKQQVSVLVNLLERVEANVRPWDMHIITVRRRDLPEYQNLTLEERWVRSDLYKEVGTRNGVVGVIRSLYKSYKKENRPRKQSATLHCEVSTLAWMNGMKAPSPKPSPEYRE